MSFNLFPFLNVKGEKKHLKYLPNTYYIVFDNEKNSSNRGWTKKKYGGFWRSREKVNAFEKRRTKS